MIRFGQSTRFYVLIGPDQEAEEPPAVPSQSKAAPSKPKTQSTSEAEVTWGFQEDAVEHFDDENLGGEDSRDVDPNAYYQKDPRKALKHWMESRGMELEFEFEEEGRGVNKLFIAKVILDVASMDPIIATGSGSRKKEAEAAASLEACVKLDRRKLLRSSHAEQRATG
jgi:hypothetical protein